VVIGIFWFVVITAVAAYWIYNSKVGSMVDRNEKQAMIALKDIGLAQQIAKSAYCFDKDNNMRVRRVDFDPSQWGYYVRDEVRDAKGKVITPAGIFNKDPGVKDVYLLAKSRNRFAMGQGIVDGVTLGLAVIVSAASFGAGTSGVAGVKAIILGGLKRVAYNYTTNAALATFGALSALSLYQNNGQMGWDEAAKNFVVGKIAEVNRMTSKVILLTDPQFSVAALVQNPRESGLVSGTLQGVCRMKYIRNNAEIQVEVESPVQAIVPRKGVLELAKLFADMDADISVSLSANHIRAESADLRFTSKLIDGKFPDYERVLPKNSDKTVISDKNEMKQCFSRVSILSNEKYRGVRLRLESGSLTTVANNPEQEEAEETINVDYSGNELEIGFNVNYLLDVMNVIRSESVKILLADSNSSALITDAGDDSATYVVMPMRL